MRIGRVPATKPGICNDDRRTIGTAWTLAMPTKKVSAANAKNAAATASIQRRRGCLIIFLALGVNPQGFHFIEL
jgi:hypothetical protein